MGNTMNKQEIFDTVYKALLEQGESSVNNGVCAYRGPNGTKCAVGHLIPDDLYEPEFEGKNILGIHNSILESIFQVDDINPYLTFIFDLQQAHDNTLNYHGLEAWKREMKSITKSYNLEFNH